MAPRLPRSFLASLAVLTACATGGSGDPDVGSPDPRSVAAVVSVENRGFLDMTVYVLDGARRVRLGIAPGNATTNLTIASSLVRGGTPLRFLCDPIGGSREPVSNEILVEPGDHVTLVIPAN